MLKPLLWWLIVIAVATVSIIFFYPVTPDTPKGTAVAFGLTVAMCLSQAVAIWYFLSSLRTFKRDLRVAYYFLATGIILFGLVELQLPIILLFANADLSALSWAVIVFYVASSLFVYAGARKFARLLSMRYAGTSILMLLGLILVAAVAAFFVPNLAPYNPDATELGPYASIFAIGAVGFTMAALVSNKLRSAMSTVYAGYGDPIRWLAITLSLFSFATYHELITKVFVPQDHWYIQYNISIWPYVVAGIALLVTGILFKQRNSIALQFARCQNNIDVVIAAAQLVSVPQAIDAEMDIIRGITVRTPDSNQLSPDDKAAAVKVYLAIENYLITQDPLRRLTREDLRFYLPADFRQALERQPASPKPVAEAIYK